MKLTDYERSLLDGAHGRAKARAMDLLVRYGEALGAERLVETRNVAGAFNASTPSISPMVAKGFDAVYSELNLDSDEVVEVPAVAVPTCQLITGIDNRNWQTQGVAPELVEQQRRGESYFGRRGINMLATCTPYQVGNVPVKGEHCAWMESSAVVYCNAVLGARTNTEGKESTGAAALTGRIPCWGYHLPERRRGTHLVEAAIDVADMMDWGLLGYWIGEIVQEEIPVLAGIGTQPGLAELKHFGAAAASSGGVEMYHIPGITPEAPTLAAAFDGRQPTVTLRYGAAERQQALANLTSATTRDVDFVMLGCPHNAIEQVARIALMLEGRRISAGTQLWVHTPHAIREVADRNGYTRMINEAGGVLMSDTCPAISRHLPKGTRTIATDSAKQAHYLPAITGVGAWFGSVEACVRAALTGRWEGEEPATGRIERSATRPGGNAAGRLPGLAGGPLVLHGRRVVGGVAEGEALVTRETISGWGGINERTGTVIERRHELNGQSFKDKVLVFPGAKGSSGWSAYFHMARLNGAAPRAMIFNTMTTKVALGAVVTRAPAITDLDQDPLDVIETGDWVKVDADRGTVEVAKKSM